MEAAQRRDPLRAWPQHEMIGIGEHDIGAERSHPFGMHRLDGGSRANRHEGGCADRSPRRRDESRPRILIPVYDIEAENLRHAPSSVLAGNSKQASPKL